MKCVVVVAVLALAQAEKFDTPITEIVTVGAGQDNEATMQGRDIEYNVCMPYEPKEYGNVKVCGANTEMLIFLRGRCEDYTHYTDSGKVHRRSHRRRLRPHQ